jgi:tetratricopeptide (TPR) repeat protein
MDENTNTFLEKVAELYNQNKFEEIIALLTNDVLEREKDKDRAAELYVWRGMAWYKKKDYNEAIANYNKVIEFNPVFEFAFYNRGLAWFAKKEYDKAIADYTKIIKLNSKNADTYYNNRGNAWKAKNEYDKAIDDYTEAIKINPTYENAYYYRGLAKKEGNIDLEGSKQDFETYLKLITDENDDGAEYAKYYIKEFDEKNDLELSIIADLISKIKFILHLDEECITHYTSLSVLKSLILDCSKFRISEGNFMHDSSEGTEFFNFLYDKTSMYGNNSTLGKNFSPKPFIGSFVAKNECDDLTMWRLYGKDKGEECRGCAITLRLQRFKEGIKNFLSNEKNKEARLVDESDINFYQVAYIKHGSTNFYIPSSDEKSRELKNLMTKLKKKVNLYKGDNSTSLEEYLNSIAFLFKRDNYKNENEVRLVVKGIEFEKEYNMDVSSPRVYIELVSIKDIVSQITLGPKVDNVSEWELAFHYRYGEKIPKIETSHLPYK